MTYTNYVVGFVFDKLGERVVLVRKNRPEWQDGKLNGSGGKFNEMESPRQAMTREYREECGYYIDSARWREIAVLNFPVGRVYFFSYFSNRAYNESADFANDEPVIKVSVRLLHELPVVRNLHYLIPFCLHCDAADSGSRLTLPIRLVEEDA